MFLGGLKEKSIVRKIQKDVAKRSFSLSRKRIATVAILQTAVAPFESVQLNALANQLGVDVANITCFSYVSKLAKEQKDDMYLVTDKHIGWNGVVKSKHVKDFVEKKFDLLVSYHNIDSLTLQALAAASLSQLKVGISEDLWSVHDLIIHTKTGEEAVFVKELNTYLKILKSKE